MCFSPCGFCIEPQMNADKLSFDTDLHEIDTDSAPSLRAQRSNLMGHGSRVTDDGLQPAEYAKNRPFAAEGAGDTEDFNSFVPTTKGTKSAKKIINYAQSPIAPPNSNLKNSKLKTAPPFPNSKLKTHD